MHEFTREDYEHAARAAGYELYAKDGRQGGVFVAIKAGGIMFWEPLSSDTDSFRLMLAGQMTILPGIARTPDGVTFIERADDIGAATSHAIFRAAIEIGKSMAQKGRHA